MENLSPPLLRHARPKYFRWVPFPRYLVERAPRQAKLPPASRPPLQKSRLGRRDKLRPRDFGNRGRSRQHFSLRKDLHNTVGITNRTIASLVASQLSSGKDTASKCLPHSAANSRYDLPQLEDKLEIPRLELTKAPPGRRRIQRRRAEQHQHRRRWRRDHGRWRAEPHKRAYQEDGAVRLGL